MAQQDIKQIRGASQGSILFLGTNSVVSEDVNNFSWDQSTNNLNINGTFKLVDGNQSSGYILTSDSNGLSSWEETKTTLTIIGSRDSNSTTSQYLRGSDGSPFNLSPFIIPYNGIIKNISISSNVSGSWTGEVRNNGSVISGAAITATNSISEYGDYNIAVSAGDRIELYCNGTSINHPSMSVLIIKS